MDAEIFNNEQDANDRQTEFFNQTKHLFVGTKYCDVRKHPTDELWAVPYCLTGNKSVDGNGETLTDDWFPQIDEL